MVLSKDAKLLDRIQYAIKELQEAEKLLTLEISLSTNQETLPTLKEMEKRVITAAWEKFHHHQCDICKALGMAPKTLRERLISYGLLQHKVRKSPTKKENDAH